MKRKKDWWNPIITEEEKKWLDEMVLDATILKNRKSSKGYTVFRNPDQRTSIEKNGYKDVDNY